MVSILQIIYKVLFLVFSISLSTSLELSVFVFLLVRKIANLPLFYVECRGARSTPRIRNFEPLVTEAECMNLTTTPPDHPQEYFPLRLEWDSIVGKTLLSLIYKNIHPNSPIRYTVPLPFIPVMFLIYLEIILEKDILFLQILFFFLIS